jgi:hypothetical protein
MRSEFSRVRLSTLVLVAACAALQPVAALGRQGSTRIVVTTGDAAPGGGQFDLFRAVAPAINDAGDVAFLVHVTGPGTAGGDGVFIHSGSVISAIARDGQPAAGGGTMNLGSAIVGLDDVGRVAFRSRIDPAGVFGTFIFDGGTTTELVRSGQPAPGGTGTLDFLSNPALNQSGQIALSANIESGAPGGPRFGIFRAGPPGGGALTQIARHGDPAPDGNGTLSTVSFGNHAIDDAGRVAFSATLEGTSGGSADRSGLFVGTGGPLQQVLRSNAPAPGGNGTFSSFGRPDLNNADQLVFGAGLTGTAGGAADDSGIYRVGPGGAPIEVARAGTLIPGGSGRYGIFRQPSINEIGQVGFLTTLTDTPGGLADDSAVFRVNPNGTVRTIAREGQTAPGGGVIHDITDNNSSVAMNDAGQFALFLNLDDVPFPDDFGIYFHDDVLGLLKVARMGDPLLGSTIAGLNMRADAAGRCCEAGHRRRRRRVGSSSSARRPRR